MKNKLIFITSWDDATELDLKLCNLLDKYDLKGSFYVIGKSIGKNISKEQVVKLSDNHEIGAHTVTHPTLTNIDSDRASWEISESKTILEEIINKPVKSFAYPKGIYNKTHIEICKSTGFSNARNIKPFYYDNPFNNYEIPITMWSYPHRIRDLTAIYRLYNNFNLPLSNPLLIKNWSLLGKKIIDSMLATGGVYHLFGHAWQVNQINGWKKLEDLFSYMAFQNNAVYCTVSEYVEKHQQAF